MGPLPPARPIASHARKQTMGHDARDMRERHDLKFGVRSSEHLELRTSPPHPAWLARPASQSKADGNGSRYRWSPLLHQVGQGATHRLRIDIQPLAPQPPSPNTLCRILRIRMGTEVAGNQPRHDIVVSRETPACSSPAGHATSISDLSHVRA